MPTRPSQPTPSSAMPARATRSASGASRSTPDSSSVDVGIRILCVDDHAVLIEGLKAQFSIDGRIGVVGVMHSAHDLLDEVSRLKPDVVLLDIEMPGPDVFETAERLRRAHPKVRFVFLSAHIRDGYLAAAYKCGAWGYFSKSDEPEDIVAGIKEIAKSRTGGEGEGTFVMTPKVKQRCAQGMTSDTTARPPSRENPARGESTPSTPLGTLTPREIEVLRLIGKGLSRNEIAAELCRSAKTVDGHQERVMKKLGVDSRAELMRFAIREGLAEA